MMQSSNSLLSEKNKIIPSDNKIKKINNNKDIDKEINKKLLVKIVF